MKNKLMATLGAATLALSMSATTSFAGYFVPGETMGVSLTSPLPEGVYAVDLETYGRSDISPNTSSGVNIPVIVWSTPWSFYNNKLEFLVATPFAHLNGGFNRVGAITFAIGPMLGHDFGNGLTGGIGAFIRSPDPSQNIVVLSGRSRTEADFRQSLQYVAPKDFLGGLTFIENFGLTTAFNNSAPGFGVNDFIAGDFTIEKTFDKITVGAVGFGHLDIQNRLFSTGRSSEVAVGGLIGYDFGRFSLTGMVTRTVALGANQVNFTGFAGKETRGWLRLILPLYVAQPPAPVVARY